MSITAGD